MSEFVPASFPVVPDLSDARLAAVLQEWSRDE
jgi:hypothetical protein